MKRVLIGTGVVLILAAIVTLSLLGGKRDKGVRVYVEAARTRDISRLVKATGVIDPRLKVDLSAHVIGKIDQLYVVEGQEIERGQPFLRLEREAFLATRDRAAAEFEIARSRVRQAEINVADSVLKLNRAERLNTAGIASVADLDIAKLNHSSQLLAAEQTREVVLQAKASLDKADDDLRKTTIYAPLTGRVTALNAEVGEVVVSGTMNNPGSVIGTISDLSEILAEVAIDETEIALIELGQSATLTVDALADIDFEGTVVEIGSSGFQRSGSSDVTYFRAKVLLSAPDPALRPGMSARVEITTAVAEQVVVVPVQSVVDRLRVISGQPEESEGAGGSGNAGESSDEEEVEVVFVVVDGASEQRAVETGLADITHVELISGLAAGEQVVTGPHRSLKDLEAGDPVRVRKRGDDDEDDD